MRVDDIYEKLNMSIWRLKNSSIEIRKENGQEVPFSISYDNENNKIILLVEE